MLAQLTPYLNAPVWHIALSGGLDSSVLLHQLVAMSREHTFPPLRAIHIHHGLQAAADAWPDQCKAFCDSLGVPLTVTRVKVAAGPSIEQAARVARYQAFEQHLNPGEVLFTAQHRDDQAETLLFRLLRGTGVRGLAGMPSVRRLGLGSLVRPLLHCSRQQLEDYASEHALHPVEDPSNRDLGFSRNFLRHQVLPLVQQRWPHAGATIARSSDHLREALELLEEVAADDLHMAAAVGPFDWLGIPSVALAPLKALSPARQRNALQSWLAPRTRMPDTQHWRGWDALRDAAADAEPRWVLADGELRRSGGRLWWLSGLWQQPFRGQVQAVNGDVKLSLPGNGHVEIRGPLPVGSLHIGYRQGGVVLDLPGRGRRDLKRLLNESGLPAFARERLPLLWADGHLHAVANLPLSASGVQLHWSPPTNAQRLR